MRVGSDVKRYRFFRHFCWKAECSLCRALTSKAKYAMTEHAEWHAFRGESEIIGPGTHRAFCDIEVLGDGYTSCTGWSTTSGGPP